MTVYHGSENGLEGPIRMVAGRNRQTCDFGQGFYMGDEPTQPRTLVCDGTRPTLYTLSPDIGGLKVHRFETDADWAAPYRTMAGMYAGYHTLSCELAIDNLREDAKAA